MLKLYLFLEKKRCDGVLGFHCHNQSCDRVYQTKSGLHNHLKYECGVKPKFYCEICYRYFKQPVSYKAHMLNIHKQIGWK